MLLFGLLALVIAPIVIKKYLRVVYLVFFTASLALLETPLSGLPLLYLLYNCISKERQLSAGLPII
jgi:hypothetical protein